MHYDKTKKTLTLGDTPRQKIIDGMGSNPTLKSISPDAKNPSNILVSLDGKNYLGSFSMKQAALIGRYHDKITTHNMYEKNEAKIKLVASMDTNGNLILTHKTIDANSSQVFQVIVTSGGQVGTIVKR